jgi:hypothetical protein
MKGGRDDSRSAIAIPAIERPALHAPGDVAPRPHPNCYWLIPGRVLAGEYPASQLQANATTRIDALLDAGIRQFVDLTEEHEGPGPYAEILDARARSRNLRIVHRRFAIPDCGVPSTALMREALDAIYDALAAQESVYVHCWGGIGRTGTVVGCLLREQGLTHVEALDVIAAKWQSMEKRSLHPQSPEWPEQFAFILAWNF